MRIYEIQTNVHFKCARLIEGNKVSFHFALYVFQIRVYALHTYTYVYLYARIFLFIVLKKICIFFNNTTIQRQKNMWKSVFVLQFY